MKISFLGAGNMAGAIINSIISKDQKLGRDLCAFDLDSSKYEKFALTNVKCAKDLSHALDFCDNILLAVKPQDYESLLLSVKDSCDVTKKTFISIAAGITTDFVCKTLGHRVPVIRVMPNTPLLCGYGATALSRNDCVCDEVFSSFCEIFSYSGVTSVLPEDKMNAVISVNSSSPAYVYLFAKALVEGGIKQGIDREVSEKMAYNAILGAAQMLILSSDMSCDDLIRMVTSKKGTTEKALEVLNDAHFVDTVISAMEACTHRADELSK